MMVLISDTWYLVPGAIRYHQTNTQLINTSKYLVVVLYTSKYTRYEYDRTAVLGG